MTEPTLQSGVSFSGPMSTPRPRIRLFLCTGADPSNSKNTIFLLRSIQKDGCNEIYIFSLEHQPFRIYTEFSKLPAMIGVTKSLKSRGQFRRIMVTFSKILYDIYFNDDCNPRFMGEYLEQFSELVKKDFSFSLDPFTSLSKKQSLQSINKDVVIMRFNNTSLNPKIWLTNLERECSHLEIPFNRNCEVPRLFVEGIALDWFNTTWTLHGTATCGGYVEKLFSRSFYNSRMDWSVLCLQLQIHSWIS